MPNASRPLLVESKALNRVLRLYRCITAKYVPAFEAAGSIFKLGREYNLLPDASKPLLVESKALNRVLRLYCKGESNENIQKNHRAHRKHTSS